MDRALRWCIGCAGAALTAAGNSLGDDRDVDNAAAVAAVQAFVDSVINLGKANAGDKTIVDALSFTEAFGAVESSGDVSQAWRTAAAHRKKLPQVLKPPCPAWAGRGSR